MKLLIHLIFCLWKVLTAYVLMVSSSMFLLRLSSNIFFSEFTDNIIAILSCIDQWVGKKFVLAKALFTYIACQLLRLSKIVCKRFILRTLRYDISNQRFYTKNFFFTMQLNEIFGYVFLRLWYMMFQGMSKAPFLLIFLNTQTSCSAKLPFGFFPSKAFG